MFYNICCFEFRIHWRHSRVDAHETTVTMKYQPYRLTPCKAKIRICVNILHCYLCTVCDYSLSHSHIHQWQPLIPGRAVPAFGLVSQQPQPHSAASYDYFSAARALCVCELSFGMELYPFLCLTAHPVDCLHAHTGSIIRVLVIT